MKTKDKVLDILREIQGDYISGQEIAEQIFVTRAAVWKAIKALEKEGYDIDAVTNKGYRLRYAPDTIDGEALQAELEEQGILLKVLHLEQVTSTNDVALEYVKEHNSPVLVIAEAQTKGRGRRGREFFSPGNTGLYMSLCFGTHRSVTEYRNITAMAAAATALAIDEAVFDGEDTAKIKWVNDIFLRGCKVAGILTECYGTLEEDYSCIVVGIGINVYTPKEDFPKELKQVAGAIFSGGQRKDGKVRSRICVALLRNLYRFLEGDQGSDRECLAIYKGKSLLAGCYVKINSYRGSYEYALVEGISDEYELLVTYEDGSKGRLATGEVSVVKY